MLVNGTLRATKANQNGLLGFGATLGGANNRYSLQPAGQAAGLGDGLRAQDWKDLFVAWAPNKNLSITLA